MSEGSAPVHVRRIIAQWFVSTFGPRVTGNVLTATSSTEAAWSTPTTPAPVAATYVTLSTNATLTSERVLTAGAGLGLTDGGAGSTITVAISDAGIVSLLSADAGGGFTYPNGANTWTRLVVAANKGIYATSATAFDTYDLSAFGRTWGGLADAPAGRTALGLGTAATTASTAYDVAGAAAAAQAAAIAASQPATAKLDALQTTIDDGFTATVTTTDATQTTCGTYTPVDGDTFTIRAVVVASGTGGTIGASYEISATFRRSGASLTAIGTVIPLATNADVGAATWSVTVDSAAAVARVRVTGQAATTIKWRTRASVVTQAA